MNEEDKKVHTGEVPQDSQSSQNAPEEETSAMPHDDKPEESSSGPLVGIAIIVIVLIAGGIYLWSTTFNQEEEAADQAPAVEFTNAETDAIVNQLNSQGTSDEVADIEADLNLTDLENLDSELDDLLNEL